MNYFELRKGDSSIPLVANIPHSSTYVPPGMRCLFALSDGELEKEAGLMADLYTDELFSCAYELGGMAVVTRMSRLVLDPERFENDDEEPMSKKGMGVIFTKTADGRQLREAPADRECLLERYYRPYHSVLEREVGSCMKKFGKCLILDCHSFSSIPLPYESDQDANRPDICLGTDPLHSPRSLVEAAVNYFQSRGFSTALNRPFAGTYVPLKFYNEDFRVGSMMIEVNKRLYMDETTRERKPEFDQIKKILKGLVAKVCL